MKRKNRRRESFHTEYSSPGVDASNLLMPPLLIITHTSTPPQELDTPISHEENNMIDGEPVGSLDRNVSFKKFNDECEGYYTSPPPISFMEKHAGSDVFLLERSQCCNRPNSSPTLPPVNKLQTAEYGKTSLRCKKTDHRHHHHQV
ncbi:unnamed protein product [Hymenolepis diminuta]|uniref:Uncharacterized protein n=1 Tax=Hymenolepis diminuta TaxID=6216 RepID=A0A564YXY5_HYMDI|nr:unnamed protein product [Hymenolepis diminuta]